MFKHMLVATDGSELSKRAVAYAVSIAAAVNAKLTAIHVVQPVHLVVPGALPEEISQDFAARLDQQAQAALQFVKETAERAGLAPNLVKVRNDEPHKAIIDMARLSRCDLIVMGSHGHRPVARFMLGSVTQKVLAESEVPVLIYRAPPSSAP